MLCGILDLALEECGAAPGWKQTSQIRSKINGLIGVERAVHGFRVEMKELF